MISQPALTRVLCSASALLFAASAFAQTDLQLRARQMPGWDPRAREGHCEIRVWVDHRAEVRLRGDNIFVHTLEGSRGRDEGSQCSQPVPFNAVRDFQVRQTEGRSRVTLAQEPSRANNFTAMILIEDQQGGGDNYAFDVSWHADGSLNSDAPAAFFDDVRACQDVVRQRFLTQNGRGSYVDFDNFADRLDQNGNPYDQNGNVSGGNGNFDQNGNRTGRNLNRGRGIRQETIQGHGSARRWNETSDLTYSCAVNSRTNQIVSGTYQLSGNSMRTNERTRLR